MLDSNLLGVDLLPQPNQQSKTTIMVLLFIYYFFFFLNTTTTTLGINTIKSTQEGEF
jgi:hypothetical protein